MLADVFRTISGIIYYELPKNKKNKPVVLSHEIIGWYIGERTIKSETPAIVVSSSNAENKDFAMGGVRKFDYSIDISFWHRTDDIEYLQEVVTEGSRQIYESLKNHRRIWVCIKCPICQKDMLSPEHYVVAHSNIFGNFSDVYDAFSANNSYIAIVKKDLSDAWQITHTGNAPTVSNAYLAVGALYKFWDDVKENNALPADVTLGMINNVKVAQGQKFTPIRLLYDCTYTQVIPVKEETEKQLMLGGQFTLTAREVSFINNFGPNNVPNGA